MGVKVFIKEQYEKVLVFVKWNITDRLFSRVQRSRLKNKKFSLIGNNCFLIGIYHKFGLEFTSPTIGLFFFPEEYIKFLENLKWYLKQPLRFTAVTRHSFVRNRLLASIKRNYPIGILGGDVEIHFLHYTNEEEALEKWNRRLLRINYENLYILFSDSEPEEFKEDLLERFEKLPFKNKIFFSSKPRNNYKCVVFVKDYLEAISVSDLTRNRKYERYLDLVKWLNDENDFLKDRKTLFSKKR